MPWSFLKTLTFNVLELNADFFNSIFPIVNWLTEFVKRVTDGILDLFVEGMLWGFACLYSRIHRFVFKNSKFSESGKQERNWQDLDQVRIQAYNSSLVNGATPCLISLSPPGYGQDRVFNLYKEGSLLYCNNVVWIHWNLCWRKLIWSFRETRPCV